MRLCCGQTFIAFFFSFRWIFVISLALKWRWERRRWRWRWRRRAYHIKLTQLKSNNNVVSAADESSCDTGGNELWAKATFGKGKFIACCIRIWKAMTSIFVATSNVACPLSKCMSFGTALILVFGDGYCHGTMFSPKNEVIDATVWRSHRVTEQWLMTEPDVLNWAARSTIAPDWNGNFTCGRYPSQSSLSDTLHNYVHSPVIFDPTVSVPLCCFWQRPDCFYFVFFTFGSFRLSISFERYDVPKHWHAFCLVSWKSVKSMSQCCDFGPLLIRMPQDQTDFWIYVLMGFFWRIFVYWSFWCIVRRNWIDSSRIGCDRNDPNPKSISCRAHKTTRNEWPLISIIIININ